MTFSKDLETFISSVSWLTEDHAVDIGTLRTIALELDSDKRSPAMIAQYGLWYRALLARAPKTDSDADDIELELRALNGI